MKTAIIKTGFWQDDDVQVMNADTKLVYLCLLTNPQRDTLPVFRVGDNMLSAYTGFNKDLINTCRQQLVDSGRILYQQVAGKWYYIFTSQDFVVPSRGHTAQAIYDREFAKLPIEIQDYVNSLYGENTTGGTTGASTSVNTNPNANTKSNAIATINKQAVQLAERLYELTNENFNFLKKRTEAEKQRDIANWSADIDKLNRLDGYEYPIIQAVVEWSQKDPFWSRNIRSGVKLRQQFDKLLIEAKIEHDNKTSRVVIAGQDNGTNSL